MKRIQKKDIIDKLSGMFANSDSFYIVNPYGMTVKEIDSVRSQCFHGGIKYYVAKNTFIAKALSSFAIGTSISENSNVLKGVSGIFFLSAGQGSFPAKLIKNLRNGSPKLKSPGINKMEIKCAMVDSEFYLGDANIEALSSLRSKSEIIGSIIDSLRCGLSQIVAALEAREK